MTNESSRDPASMRVLAHAKLNLSLRVLAREESGYHSIETLLARLELSDTIDLDLLDEPGIQLEVRGNPEVPTDASNLCWQAAEVLCREAGYGGGVRIRLQKEIPAGAGLGGGSADAAAVLRGLNDLLGGPLDDPMLVELAGLLGSDVPFGLCPSALALAWGRGRRMLPLPPPPVRYVLVVVPDFEVGAGQAYGWLAEDRATGLGGVPGPALLPSPAMLSDPWALTHLAVNDLEGPVFRRHPALLEIRQSLADLGAEMAMLCGSGSCVAGVFAERSRRDEAALSVRGLPGVSTISTATAP